MKRLKLRIYLTKGTQVTDSYTSYGVGEAGDLELYGPDPTDDENEEVLTTIAPGEWLRLDYLGEVR